MSKHYGIVLLLLRLTSSMVIIKGETLNKIRLKAGIQSD